MFNTRLLLSVDSDRWQISTADGGHEIGKLCKQWAGMARELASAHNYSINCKYSTSFIRHYVA